MQEKVTTLESSSSREHAQAFKEKAEQLEVKIAKQYLMDVIREKLMETQADLYKELTSSSDKRRMSSFLQEKANQCIFLVKNQANKGLSFEEAREQAILEVTQQNPVAS